MPSSSLHDAIVDRLMDDRAEPLDLAVEIAEAFRHAAAIEDGSGRDRDARRAKVMRDLANSIEPQSVYPAIKIAGIMRGLYPQSMIPDDWTGFFSPVPEPKEW